MNPAVAERKGLGLDHLKVMVVDDNEHMLYLVRTILGVAGIRGVRTRTDALSAIESLSHEPADLIITDLDMTPIDGIAFVRRLRARPETRTVPVLMLTGHTGEALVREAIGGGVDDFVAKPVSARALIERIRALIERAGPRRAGPAR